MWRENGNALNCLRTSKHNQNLSSQPDGSLVLTAFTHFPHLNSTSSQHKISNMKKSHVFGNGAGVYMVCMCKLTELDLSTSMPEHVTHKLQNEFFSQEAESWLASDKVSPV